MQWPRIALPCLWAHYALILAFWGMHTDAIKSMTGESRTCLQHVVTASSKLSMHATCLLYDGSSCTWCCCPCSTRREGTGRIMNTAMLFSNAGSRAIHSKSFMPPRPPSTRPTSSPSKIGVLQPTLHWPMLSLPWIHLTSRALSRGQHLGFRAAPRRVCLGKHLRARKLRPQARPRPKRKRLRKPTLTRGKQAVARFYTSMMDGWPKRLAQCAHGLAVLCCVVLLPRVVLFMRSATKRYANRRADTQACNDPTDLSSRQAPLRGHRVISLAMYCTSTPSPQG